VNRATRTARGGLTIAIKVPTFNGGADKFKTKDGIFRAVSPILVERFQMALTAKYHRGLFFDNIGNLTDGLVVQQILKGAYIYPLDLEPATQLLFKETATT
jgi:hypothetical protein